MMTGQMLTLVCMVNAQPLATFAQIARFMGNESLVPKTVNYNTDMMREFNVTYQFTANFNNDDGAVFQCFAVNANGNATRNATITVQGELYNIISHSCVLKLHSNLIIVCVHIKVK